MFVGIFPVKLIFHLNVFNYMYFKVFFLVSKINNGIFLVVFLKSYIVTLFFLTFKCNLFT